MDKFQIGKFDVDVKRCRISSADHVAVVEPKVMEVLQFLYRNAGEVVSHEQLFNAVWPGSIFNTSSVQRCIALLRKALNEDSRNAAIVVTHPKRGYSLELPQQLPKKRRNYHYAYSLAFIGLLALGVGLWLAFAPAQVKMDYARLLPLSSSGASESFHALSPDGQFLAFVREGEVERKNETQGNIWLKELNTGKEQKLTNYDSHYSSLGWKPDGSALAFMEKTGGLSTMSYFAFDTSTHKVISKNEIASFSVFYVSSDKLEWHSENRVYFVEMDKRNNDTWLSHIDVSSENKQQLLVIWPEAYLFTQCHACSNLSNTLYT